MFRPSGVEKFAYRQNLRGGNPIRPLISHDRYIDAGIIMIVPDRIIDVMKPGRAALVILANYERIRTELSGDMSRRDKINTAIAALASMDQKAGSLWNNLQRIGGVTSIPAEKHDAVSSIF